MTLSCFQRQFSLLCFPFPHIHLVHLKDWLFVQFVHFFVYCLMKKGPESLAVWYGFCGVGADFNEPVFKPWRKVPLNELQEGCGRRTQRLP